MGNVWVGVWARHREVDEGVGERVGGCISKGGSAEGEGNGGEGRAASLTFHAASSNSIYSN